MMDFSARLMHGMSVQHLIFNVCVQDTIVLEGQPGSALRGALYHALRQHYCSEPYPQQLPGHVDRCPVCWLLEAEDPENGRGRDLARPITVEPPAPGQYRKGEMIRIGYSLIGQARDLLPYVVRAVERMGEAGIGRGRGHFQLVNIEEYDPLLDAHRSLTRQGQLRSSKLVVTMSRIQDAAQCMSQDHIALELLTPLRLIHDGKPVRIASLDIFIARLLERCQQLARTAITDDPPSRQTWYAAAQTLKNIAAGCHISRDETQWKEAFSKSARQNRVMPIGGLMGVIRYEGALAPLLPWLLWGQSLHVGKNAVKGDGWYRILD